MSADDDLPDYLKGVEPTPGFDARDNVTIRPGQEAELGRGAALSPRFQQPDEDEDDDEDDDREPRPLLPFPPQVLLVALGLVVALGMLGAAGVAAMGTWVADAERATLAAGGHLARAVDEESKIIDELGSRGANRDELMAHFADIDKANGHRRGAEALEFARLVDLQVVAIGDVRGTMVYDRQKRINLAQSEYERALAGWQSAAGNPLGRLACAVGLANPPPP